MKYNHFRGLMRIIKCIFSTLAFILILPIGIPTARADYAEAVALYNRGEYKKAIQELQPDLENNRDWEFGHRLLGLCYLNLNNNALAASSLSRAVELRSTSFSTYFGLAQAYFNMQKYGDCITALNKGEPIAAKDTNPEASQSKLYRLRGSSYYRLNNFKETIEDLTRALRLSDANWTDFTMLGISYYNTTRIDEAIESLEKSLALNPNQQAIKGILGNAYLEKGTDALSKKQFQNAVKLFNKAGEYDSRNGYVYYNLAESYLFEKKYSSAEEALKKAMNLMPQNENVLERLGLVYEKMKKWDLALETYQKARNLKPSKSLNDAIERVKNNSSQ